MTERMTNIYVNVTFFEEKPKAFFYFTSNEIKSWEKNISLDGLSYLKKTFGKRKSVLKTIRAFVTMQKRV